MLIKLYDVVVKEHVIIFSIESVENVKVLLISIIIKNNLLEQILFQKLYEIRSWLFILKLKILHEDTFELNSREKRLIQNEFDFKLWK